MTSGLKIVVTAEDAAKGFYMPTQRLILTPEGRLLEEGTEGASGTLFCVPGRPVLFSEARKFGLVPEVEAPAVVAEVATTPVPAAAEVDTTPRRRGRAVE